MAQTMFGFIPQRLLANAKRENDALMAAEVAPLRQSLRAMLDAYWGKGDGEQPPKFIRDAAALCGYDLNQ